MDSQESTSIQPLGFEFLICMGVLIWTLPRRKAVLPLLITACYMPLGQMLVVGGMHFQLFRILLLVGWCRILTRRENANFKLSQLD